HRGFKCPAWFEYFLSICATLALEGGPMYWVATHRAHHQHSDKEGDPHSPNDGGWWAHAGWIIFGETNHNNTEMNARFCPDLNKVAFHRWLNSYHWLPVT